MHSSKSIPIRHTAFINIIQGNYRDYYKSLGEIGSGASGVVVKVLSKATNDYRAIKSIKKKELSREETDRMFLEFETVKKLDHPNIIKIFECPIDRHQEVRESSNLATNLQFPDVI